MIVDLLHWEGYIIAVNTQGQLLIWNLTPHKYQSTYLFQHNISLLPSFISKNISKNELLGVTTLQNTIVAYNQISLFVIDLPTMRESLQESMLQTVAQIKLLQDLQQNEKISTLVAVDPQSIVYGTNFSKLYYYNVRERLLHISKSIDLQKSQHLGLFATSNAKLSEITSLVALKDRDLLIVGCDNGKILIVQVQHLEILNQISQNINNPIEKVNKLYLTSIQQKLFSIHQNYVIEWNYKLNSMICCYEYTHASGVILNQETLYLGGNSNNLSRVKDQVSLVKLSTRCVGVMRELVDDLFCVGGTDNLVDVFQNGMRLITLYKK